MKKLPPLKVTIPARLRPHIRASFPCRLGYNEQQAVIYMLQDKLIEYTTKDMSRKCEETLEFLKAKSKARK